MLICLPLVSIRLGWQLILVKQASYEGGFLHKVVDDQAGFPQ